MGRYALLLAPLALALGAADAAPAAGPVGDCMRAGTPVTAGTHVRVYRHATQVHACSLETGRRMFLGHAPIKPVAVAGRLVAWYGAAPNQFRIADVRRGRLLLRRRYPERAQVREVVLTRTGAAAWIEDSPRRVRALRRRDSRGTKVLARVRGEEGLSDLALGRLRTTDSPRLLLYWTERGRPASAALEPPEARRLPPARRTCGRRGDTIFANAWVRVWEEDYAYYACSLETRQPIFLGEEDASSSGSQFAQPWALAGRLVVVERASCGPLGVTPPPTGPWCRDDFLQLVDIRARTRRTLTELHNEAVWGLALKPNGSVAWIAASGGGSADERVVRGIVRRMDRRGDAVVASGRDSDIPTRLARSRSTLYWTQSGTPRSATFR